MAGIYRLDTFGFKLASGAYVLKAADLARLAEAEGIIVAAEARAREIIASAEDVFKSEAERGFQKGLTDAQFAAVDRLIAESGALDRALADLQQDLNAIVAASVRKLIDGFDDQAKDEAVVKNALKQMRREKRLQVRVSPSQSGRLKTAANAIKEEFPEIELIDVVEDSTLDAPRIIVESAVGRIDGNIGDRLDDLDALIRGAARRVAAEAAEESVESAP